MLMPVAGCAHDIFSQQGGGVFGANDGLKPIGLDQHPVNESQQRQTKEVIQTSGRRHAPQRGRAAPRFYRVEIDGLLLVQEIVQPVLNCRLVPVGMHVSAAEAGQFAVSEKHRSM